MSKMEQRKITKGMQEVLESPEFIKTQTQIVDIMQKYRLFATQLNEAFEKIRVPMRTLNTSLLNEASPLHNLSQNLSVTLSQISEFINSYEEADAKLKDIEQEITPVINTNWDSSQMVESVVIQVKCLNTIISEAEMGKTFDQIADLPNSYLAVDDTETGSGCRIPLWMFGLLY